MKPLSDLSLKEVIQKLEYFCSYQERCHYEVENKLFGFQLSQTEKDTVIVHLIDHNYLNEERFALLFVKSKLNQKQWGKVRITLELKARKISSFLVNKALKTIDLEVYYTVFESLSERFWYSILEKNKLKKQKKFCDYLLRKGWESSLVYEKYSELAGKTGF